MKIRRYVAKDMRSALAQIKEELGPDAVIMSNKKIPEGIELMAAIDYNETVPTTKKTSNERSISSNSTIISREVKPDIVSFTKNNDEASNITELSSQERDKDSLSALLNRTIQQKSPNNVGSQQLGQEKNNIKQQLKSFTERLEQSNSVHSTAENNQKNKLSEKFGVHEYVNYQEIDNIKNEMSSIRQLLEHQVSGLIKQDSIQKDPMRAILVERLIALGITAKIADQVADYVPKKANEDQSWQAALKLLTQQLNTTDNDIINQGGIVALVGPTGVGKTTTIAKLAARFAQVHGHENVALISTDTFRIAGFEQLQTYGRIIGCQVKLAKDKQALEHLIQEFSKKKLVLIDTAGMGQRDLRLAEHLTTLISNTRVRIRNYLVLAANTQQKVMQENVERFQKIPLAGCIYTKLDESLSVGEIISTAIQNSLSIGYLTDGQRVPEDIKVANADKLVMLANNMATQLVYKASNFQQYEHLSSAVI